MRAELFFITLIMKTIVFNSDIHIFVFRIHYPLPLPYMGKPDPRALQETIRQLREELKTLRHQVFTSTVFVFYGKS